jgi:intracellular multiplication protein IcmD
VKDRKNVLQQQQQRKGLRGWLYAALTVTVSGALFYTGYAGAVTSAPSIGSIATTIVGSFSGIAKLVTAGSYIAGMGFALSSILKFKQHKDNPTQIPIGTPIALLFIAAALIFLPTIFGAANATIFGGSGSAGGISGVTG